MAVEGPKRRVKVELQVLFSVHLDGNSGIVSESYCQVVWNEKKQISVSLPLYLTC